MALLDGIGIENDPKGVGGPVNKPHISTEAKDESPEHTAESPHNHAIGPDADDGGSSKQMSTEYEGSSKLQQSNTDEDREAQEKNISKDPDGEDDEDNTSDGESVDEFEDYYSQKRAEYYRKMDQDKINDKESIDERMHFLRQRHRDLEHRVKLAPKRLKQTNQYAGIMEERICLLEERCFAFDNKILKASGILVPPELPEVKPPAKSTLSPDLGFKFWKDFSSKAPRTNIIDVLIGEPAVTRSEMIRRKKASTSTGQEAISLLEAERSANQMDSSERRNLDEEVAELRGTRLPERIRFNVSSIPRLFWKSCMNEVYDDIMLRPFKPLIRKAEEIHDAMFSIQKALTAMITERPASRQDGSSQDSKPNRKANDEIEKTENSENQENFEETDLITKAEWETIVRDFNLYHCEECMNAMALEWPNKSAFERSCTSVRNLLDSIILPVHLKFRKRRTQTLHFQDLWHLFQTGDLIVDKMHTQNAGNSLSSVKCRRVLLTRGGRRVLHPSFPPPLLPWTGSFLQKEEEPLAPINGINVFAIYAYYLDFDGSVWRPVRERFVIHPYSGERNITDLEIYPVEYADGTEKRLQERGKRFHDLVTAKTVPYVDCTGIDLDTKEEINDKVIVDVRSYFNSEGTEFVPYIPPSALNVSETSDCYLGMDCATDGQSESRCLHRKQIIIPDQSSDLEIYQDHIYGKLEFNAVPYDLKLWVPDFAICHYRIFAYKLQSRDWVQVEVETLKAPKKRDMSQGFDLLVLPEDHKQIIESQVREHFRKRGQQGQRGGDTDDIDLVRGKGQGLIILLHGAPGVGKTCTAECIAELMGKPLYPITCGDLGSTAQEVEVNLRKHFTLASKWDCVMLLDEADVFLAQRKNENLERNSIVSVFLRMLEYYKGLLFLTTNRVGAFDEAFKSRVHISLFYPNFDKETTIKVWKTFIKQAKKKLDSEGRKNVTVASGEIKKFAKTHWEENPKARWNGRQIRNAFHTAVAMAEFQAREKETGEGYDANKDVKITIGREQFEKIAKTAKEFDNYMTETMGDTYDGKASRTGMRKKEREAERKREREREREDAKAREKKGKTSKKKDDSSDDSDSSEEDGKEKSGSKKARGKKKSETESENSDSGSE
ncbi:hypothetical protein HBI56_196210 [Parastagonospora nodorum]|nr:hypothetical protein HBH52_206410 [Parastagonospora nodorum]KAH4091804.1 hypothetical protein HBH46_186170 [Parastagonospora nodorum]KAH4913337.1 hypothetical protein HBH74_164480 [Parastagonospora nodorum]KAH4926881.1 hypothetical protein HBH73_203050 [Parastagonospora nodorum]KAH5091878.1 hypothetical protein HBH72_195710 [Parastagonospora nodorum]